MPPPVQPPTRSTVGPVPSLIPAENAVHIRLVAICREARLLRRLLRLCREATTPGTDLNIIAPDRKGVTDVR